ncbi:MULTISPECIES: low molecular weight phosphotyrosine protein phosphatase [unclassified Adlercreutzia]|uniref:low molecular weight protein-tyrosine-phosphatase n=1 Tax=unclassified Adlercreutzia TaxID=2636013 RepID=UPI001F156D6E|nr:MULTISPECIES: low molecular weight phosphotyrosine protein phosphatase [unclassified Adlercreutzia]
MKNRMPIKILFVCHGNICRSPMAEFLFKDMVSKRGLSECFHIESAATTTDEIGNSPHSGTVKILKREGISCKGKTARQITPKDYNYFDVIIGMDSANMRSMERIFGKDTQNKLHKMMEFAGNNRDVADPWYTGNFEETYSDIADGCVGLLSWLGY